MFNFMVLVPEQYNLVAGAQFLHTQPCPPPDVCVWLQ